MRVVVGSKDVTEDIHRRGRSNMHMCVYSSGRRWASSSRWIVTNTGEGEGSCGTLLKAGRDRRKHLTLRICRSAVIDVHRRQNVGGASFKGSFGARVRERMHGKGKYEHRGGIWTVPEASRKRAPWNAPQQYENQSAPKTRSKGRDSLIARVTFIAREDTVEGRHKRPAATEPETGTPVAKTHSKDKTELWRSALNAEDRETLRKVGDRDMVK